MYLSGLCRCPLSIFRKTSIVNKILRHKEEIIYLTWNIKAKILDKKRIIRKIANATMSKIHTLINKMDTVIYLSLLIKKLFESTI